MTQRLKIRERIEEISTGELEGSLSLILQRVQGLIKKHGADAQLVYNEHFYYDYDSEPTPRYELYVEREENDTELKQRLFEQAEHTRKREEAEKAEFERLSKKFGVE